LKLCDEDLRANQLVLIHLFHLTNDVDQPLEMLLCSRDPQEEYLPVKQVK
jgi:hypothetical protein